MTRINKLGGETGRMSLKSAPQTKPVYHPCHPRNPRFLFRFPGLRSSYMLLIRVRKTGIGDNQKLTPIIPETNTQFENRPLQSIVGYERYDKHRDQPAREGHPPNSSQAKGLRCGAKNLLPDV